MIAFLARALVVALPAACGTFAAAAPHSVLLGGLAWLGFLLAALAGFGHGMAKLFRVDGDLGLRLIWGTAGFMTVSGCLLAAGSLNVYAYGVLLALGFALYAWRQVSRHEPALFSLGRAIVGAFKNHPHEALLYSALVVLALVNIIGAIPPQDSNVYDDDIAYTPMVRRLLEAGDLYEPFGFRRMCSYGGQSVLGALAAVRGTIANVYLVDHGLFFLVTLLLICGCLRRAGSDRFVGGLLIFILALLPDSSINTGSHWTGVALFVGLYRTLADVSWSPRSIFLAGLVAGTTCTLRQNYLPVAVLALALPLLFHSIQTRRVQGKLWVWALAGGVATLFGFVIAIFQSNHTFLYPLMLGTANPDVPMAPPVWNGFQQTEFFLHVLLAPDLRLFLPLLPILFLQRDRRPGLPLLAFTAACTVGFVLLMHSFALSDADNLWRYAFAYTMALSIILVVEGTRAGELQLPSTARFWVIACLLAQLLTTIKPVSRKFNTIGSNLSAATRSLPHSELERDYETLQSLVPAGERLAVLLDEPVHLDYRRNQIFNLDYPGVTSLPPGMPNFRGAEAMAEYFRGQKIRYLAFVRGTHSRYFYRRGIWVHRLIIDTELWTSVAPYFIDTLDNFDELARVYPVLFEKDGMVLVDLARRSAP